MSRFLKLTNKIINTSQIITIAIHPNTYHMYMSNSKITGFFLFSSGSLDTDHNIIEIRKNDHPTDYHLVTEWINKL